MALADILVLTTMVLFELPDPLQLDLGRRLTKLHLFPYPGPELRVI
jgi:hypothetical protein